MPPRSGPIAERLLEWFSDNRRDYPWRIHYANGDPYHVLFAEMMLQRTRADQVARVYVEFFSKFPTLGDLLEANEKEILGTLRPLGLGWRNRLIVEMVRSLKKGGSVIPRTLDGLTSLPGVGEYAATAVLVYAFGEDRVALDTNSMRILSRIFGLKHRRGAKPTAGMRTYSGDIVPRGRAKEFNMALMDFGALVCRERNPDCVHCPVNASCLYFRRLES